MKSLYPDEFCYLADQAELAQADAHFIGAFVDGQLLGIAGSLRKQDDTNYAEIKRVFIDVRYRGKGLATALMQALETRICNDGIQLAKLETGSKQPAAIRLYTKLGYQRCAPFGGYKDHPLSVFMEKQLS